MSRYSIVTLAEGFENRLRRVAVSTAQRVMREGCGCRRASRTQQVLRRSIRGASSGAGEIVRSARFEQGAAGVWPANAKKRSRIRKPSHRAILQSSAD